MTTWKESIKCPFCQHIQMALVLCDDTIDDCEAIRETACEKCGEEIKGDNWEFVDYSTFKPVIDKNESKEQLATR